MSEAVVVTGAGVGRGARRLALLTLVLLPFDVAYGAAAVASGLSPVEAILTSAVVFAGAAQFAALDLMHASLVSLALVVLAVNARHLVLGATLAPWANAAPLNRRLLVLTFLSDANYADTQAARREGERDFGVLLGGGLTLWVGWVAGTAIGALAGAGAGELEAYGADVAMAAFFTAAIAPACRKPEAAVPAAIAALVAVASAAFLPAGWNIVAAAVAGGAAGALRV